MGKEPKGWGVEDSLGINLRTVSDTRRSAIINWLVVEANQRIFDYMTDDHINALWDAHKGEAKVIKVRVVTEAV
jgi:hypothetical protein